MRYLLWILKLILFLLVFLFMVRNTDIVTVRYYLGGEWQAPLFLVLAIAFGAGVALGLAACLSRIFRQRREIAALKRGLGGSGDRPESAEPIDVRPRAAREPLA